MNKKLDIELAKHRLKRAEDTFNDGCSLIKNGSIHSSLNRFYYASFYAARAVLALFALDSSKHKGIISLFNKHIVNENIIDKEKSKVLRKTFDIRQKSDYEDFAEFDVDTVEEIKNDVRDFIESCEKTVAVYENLIV